MRNPLLLFALVISIYNFSFSNEMSDVIDSTTISEFVTYEKKVARLDSLLAYQTGTINLDGLALLNLQSGFKYLAPDQTKLVIEEAWGNPPQETLGLILADTVNPYMMDAWAVIISYTEDGFIDDDEAKNIDYDRLMIEMQHDAKIESENRRTSGYVGFEIEGWAEPPYYDTKAKKMYWAEKISFDGSKTATLNYEVRILGRKGYISLNAVADISQLDMVKNSMQLLLPYLSFQRGNKYAEFNPDVDQVAAYGIGALVTGKAASKRGFFQIVVQFFTKTWKFIIIGLAGLWTVIKKLAGFKSIDTEH